MANRELQIVTGGWGGPGLKQSASSLSQDGYKCPTTFFPPWQYRAKDWLRRDEKTGPRNFHSVCGPTVADFDALRQRINRFESENHRSGHRCSVQQCRPLTRRNHVFRKNDPRADWDRSHANQPRQLCSNMAEPVCPTAWFDRRLGASFIQRGPR